MDLSDALWCHLPVEILDQVLSFLHVPDLCRYRTVCKRWNQLICNPEFGSLCAQNASKREASFIAMRYSCNFKKRKPSGWCFLDLNARRWYVINDDDEGIRHSLFQGIVGMDGGLVCQVLKSFSPHTVIVYNPIAKTHKELPLAPEHWSSDHLPDLNMVVDTISQSFKVFLTYHTFDSEVLDDPSSTLEERLSLLNSPILQVYDSATNEWKGVRNPPCIRHGVGDVSSVMFQGFLYLFLPSYPSTGEYPLWRYNLVEDSWENVLVHIPEELHCPELIVNASRLFLVAWYDDERWTMKVSELKIPDLTQEMLFDLKTENSRGFDLKTGIDHPMSERSCISVIGLGNSLMFMYSTGVTAVFDLVTRSWDHSFPPNPLAYLPDERCWFSGEQMNLLLPSTFW